MGHRGNRKTIRERRYSYREMEKKQWRGRKEREGEKAERNYIHSLTKINLQTKIQMPLKKVNVKKDNIKNAIMRLCHPQ